MIADQELHEINHSIFIRYGYDFSGYESDSLKRRIYRIMRKFQLYSGYDLWRRMLSDPTFIHTYINEITVGHTEMFRNPVLWKKVRDQLLPQVEHHRKLRCWHAGCASGEEVFSMAVVLHEKELLDKTYLIGTDLNQEFIRQANHGYVEKMMMPQNTENYAAFSAQPPSHLEQYLTTEGHHTVLKPFLRKDMHFQHQSLTREMPFGQFDIIFCRNVLIYFNERLQESIIRKFHQKLRIGGFLILGYFESLPPNLEIFEVIDFVDKIYRRIN